MSCSPVILEIPISQGQSNLASLWNELRVNKENKDSQNQAYAFITDDGAASLTTLQMSAC